MLGNYIDILVVVSIIASISMTIAPKGSAKAIIGLISGLAVIIVLLKPLTSVKNINLDVIISQFDSAARTEQNNYAVKQDNLLKELIADKTSAYILAKAQALNIDCDVNVTVGGDIPVPQSAVISGRMAPDAETQDKLSEFLSFDCGIAKENQRFVWE